MRSWLFVIAVCAACSPATQSAPPAPLVSEMPPSTNDPGAVQDERPVQSSIPPEKSGAGSGEATEPRPDGASCFASADCDSGTCEGQGCGPSAPGKCMPKSRACTRDLRPYCGCDGKTFQSSGSCPGQRFSAKQACP